MNDISKVSDITTSDISEFLRLTSPSASDNATLNNLLGIAKKFISSYTGHTESELDDYQDFCNCSFSFMPGYVGQSRFVC